MSDTDDQAVRLFNGLIANTLPALKRQALGLTRNEHAAQDLVHDAIENALKARERFEPGSNFSAWMSTILRNRFISGLRKRRETTDIADLPEGLVAARPAQEGVLVLREVDDALAALPEDQREALRAVVLDGQSYEGLARDTACAVGTAKSRVFRARRTIEEHLDGRRAPDPLRALRADLDAAQRAIARLEREVRDLRARPAAPIVKAPELVPLRDPPSVITLHVAPPPAPIVKPGQEPKPAVVRPSRPASRARAPLGREFAWPGGSIRLKSSDHAICRALRDAEGETLTVERLAELAGTYGPLNPVSVQVYICSSRKELAAAGAPYRIEKTAGGYRMSPT